MTKMKLCGLSRECDIEWANEIKPEFIGFVFAPKSSRYVEAEKAEELKKLLDPEIQAVGVFVNESLEKVAELLEKEVIDIAQLHGNEDDNYIAELREKSGKPIIKAFRVDTEEDVKKAELSKADYILLDSGNGGTGSSFDWSLLKNIQRPFFLAGGLNPENAAEAVRLTGAFAVDVSSGIETDKLKDKDKMAAFAAAVRSEK